MNTKKSYLAILGLIILIMVFVQCAPNSEKFETNPAGFWAGLWHGFIGWLTFIIGLFTDTVRFYEVNNNGGWYDFGFLLGIGVFLGGGSCCGPCKKRKRHKSPNEQEWEEIGIKVEEKIRDGIKSWADESEKKGKDWEDIGKKIEEKIKRELRNWAEK